MFDRLQKKWKVNGLQLLLILCTFAIGGSLTGIVGRKLMSYLPLENGVAWIIIYILLVTLIWPFAVLSISVFFGQFRFFTGYLGKMGRRMRILPSKTSELSQNPKSRIAIFASGAGSNARRIMEHFQNHPHIEVALVLCNKPGAGVIKIAEEFSVPVLMIEKERFFRGDAYLPDLKKSNIKLLVLAGFLWKIPQILVDNFRSHIINIHPALLPGYGGKGMYGENVHAAVIASGDKESGITIHYVDEHYDNGDIIFQARCPVMPDDSPQSLAARIHQLEHEHFPQVIEKLL